MINLRIPVECATASDRDRPGVRITLYSHDTMGLGHVRRNLLIAQALVRGPLQADVLMITGAREAGAFALPPRADWLTLPALRKGMDGQYQARSLGISVQTLCKLRGKTIQAAVEAFEPDVLIVDNVPRGAVRELDPTLEDLRASARTRCVLGLRDVLDDPSVVSREWARAANVDAIREHYDAVWVYGDPAVYDLAQECRFPLDVQEKICYTGYLDQRFRLTSAPPRMEELLDALALPPGQLVLCLVGGGQDGARLAEAFAQAEMPTGTNGLIVTGPFMPPEAQRRVSRLAARRPCLRVLEFIIEPNLFVSRADRVIAMGGYNTICEVLSYEKPALIVPRVRPRREQLIRAERMRDLGLIDVLHPEGLAPRLLTEWLSRQVHRPPAVDRRVDLNGLSRLPYLLQRVGRKLAGHALVRAGV